MDKPKMVTIQAGELPDGDAIQMVMVPSPDLIDMCLHVIDSITEAAGMPKTHWRMVVIHGCVCPSQETRQIEDCTCETVRVRCRPMRDEEAVVLQLKGNYDLVVEMGDEPEETVH